jgi:hypothetical protein
MVVVCSSLLIGIQPDSNLVLVSAGSTWKQTSKSDFSQGTFINVIINHTGDAAELELDLSRANHWINKTPPTFPTNYPAGRYGSDMAHIPGTDKVLLFGGWAFSGVQSDTWIYDASDNKWTLLQPSNKPSQRGDHKMAYVSTDDKVVLFGGRISSANDETWVFDYSNKTWQETTPLNPNATNNPELRFDFEMASIWDTDKVILFGGYFGTKYYDSLWIYDVSDAKWSKINPLGIKPSHRRNAEMTAIYGTDKVLLFGGNGTNETWLYDLSNNNWTEMARGPNVTYDSKIATIFGTSKVLLFVGSSSGDESETWLFDLNAGPIGNWTKLLEITSPDFRTRHTMASINGTENIVLFGGQVTPSPWIDNETWIFEHNATAFYGIYISKPFDTGANSTFYSIDWNADVPSNTNLSFQLRTAANKNNLTENLYSGPNGSDLSFYNTSNTAIWEGHNGHRWLQVKAYFNRTNLPITPKLKDVTITYNCLPEINVLAPLNGSILSTNKPDFQWDFIDFDSIQQHAFQVLIDNEQTFNDINYDSSIQINTDEKWTFPVGTIYSELPDGDWFWKVRTQDIDGAWTNFSNVFEIKIDTRPPSSVITQPLDNGFYNALDNISGTANDFNPGSGINKVEIAIKRLSNDQYWNGFKWVSTINWLSTYGTNNWTFDANTVNWISGERFSVQSRATDLAALVEQPYSKITFSIDLENPNSAIINPIENSWLNRLDNITGNSDDSGGAGISKIEVCIQQWGVNKYWDGTNWNLGETWLTANGTMQWWFNSSAVLWENGKQYVISSRASDLSDNMEEHSYGNTFKFDSKPPESLSIIIDDNDEFSTDTIVNLSVHGVDLDSGISSMSFSIDAVQWTAWEPFVSESELQLSAIEGEKTIFFRLIDIAGNIAEPIFDQIILDSKPPENLSIIINDGANYTNSRSLTISVNASDSGSGLNMIAFSFDGKIWQQWQVFKNTSKLTIPANTEDGVKSVYFKITDKAGNIAGPVYDSIILDTTPPGLLSIIINDGVAEVNTTQVLLKLSAEDNDSGVSQMAFSTDGEIWKDWKPFKPETQFNLSGKAGEKTIYFRVMDNVGNIADPISSKVILNITKTEPDDGPEMDTGAKDKGSDLINYMLAIIFVIIIIIAFLLVIQNRKKRSKQKSQLTKAVTVKPQTPISADSTGTEPIFLTPQLEQLPITAGQQTTHPPEPVTGAIQLEDKSSAIAQVPSAQAMPQVPEVKYRPRLPPGNINGSGKEKHDIPSEAKEPVLSHTLAMPGSSMDANINTSPTVPKSDPSSNENTMAMDKKPGADSGQEPSPNGTQPDQRDMTTEQSPEHTELSSDQKTSSDLEPSTDQENSTNTEKKKQ